tara:strand:+ start:4204 stop:4389 length:186 start_codon:yes stop_codon:yes gene_type:complete
MHQGKKHKKTKKNAWDGATELIPTPIVLKKPTKEEIDAYNEKVKKNKKNTKTKMKVKKNAK